MQPLAIVAVVVCALPLLYKAGVRLRDKYRWRRDLHRCTLVRRARIEGGV